MWVLVILLIAGASLLMGFTFLNRKKKNEDDIEVTIQMDEDCCGAHEVCDRDSLLSTDCEIVYYDDEELDDLSNTPPENYTKEQIDAFSDVFYTLRESDVAGWLRSLQLRKINLPEILKEEALLIVRERRTQ